jgi:predicted RNA-binding protein
LAKSKPIGIGVGVAILGLIIVYASTQNGSLEESNDSMSDTDLAEASIDWNYYDLLKNIDELEGKIIHFTGTVNVASNNGVFGINVGESSIREDVIFVEYNKEEFVKQDVVEGFGYVKGIRNLERTNTVGGADILEQVPNIEAIKVSCTKC